MINETWCLGISLLGKCSYDPASPVISQFSIGEGISAVALIFVLYQLIGDIEKVRIYIRQTTNYIAHFLFFFSLCSIFLAAVLPFIPGQALPLIGYPIFWELTAGGTFISAIILFLTVIKRPICITKRNSQKYIEITYKVIASNKEPLLKQFAIEIERSIKPIVTMTNEAKNDIETIKKANTLLMLWSDKYFCKTIVNHAVLTLHTAISVVKCEANYTDIPGRAFIQELISQSITSDNSLLNRENEFYGLGLFKNMTTEIFGSYEFVNSRYRPLDFGLRFYKENNETNLRYIKNYFMCLNEALKACITSNSFKIRHTNPFDWAFNEISHLSNMMAFKLRHVDKDIASESHPYLVLSEISSGFHKTLSTLYEHEITPDFNEEGYDYSDDESIYGIIAWGLFKFFESLSICLAHDDLLRGLAVSLWLDVEGKIQGNDQLLKRMVVHLIEKSNDNIIKGRYPMIVRLLISLDGLSEPKPNSQNDPRIKLFNHVMNLLKVHYGGLFNKTPALAKDILPENVTYNSKKQLLIAKYFLGENSMLKVN